MSTGAQTNHRAARASALNEMWVEVNRSLGAARDRVALCARAVVRWLLMLAVRISHESWNVRTTRRGDQYSLPF